MSHEKLIEERERLIQLKFIYKKYLSWIENRIKEIDNNETIQDNK